MSARAVVIGASAGAIQALGRILPVLPGDFALAVLVVVHVPPDRKNALSGLFAKKCAVPVMEGEDKAPIEPGTIVFAPPDYHMLVEPGETVALSTDPPLHFSRPSIDALFETAADVYGSGLIGVVLTGANEDGAQGLAQVVACGGTALVQDPASAYARAMPEAALAACPAASKVSLDQIAQLLVAAGATKA